MEAPSPGTARWRVLFALTEHQTYWTAHQLAGHTELPAHMVELALPALVAGGLAAPVKWAHTEPMWRITDRGRQLLDDGGQLRLAVA